MTHLQQKPPQERLAAIYRDYLPAVRFRVRQFVTDEQTSADIAQDVFLGLVKASNQRDIPDVLKFLHHLATQRAVRYLQRSDLVRMLQRGAAADLSIIGQRLERTEDQLMFKKILKGADEEQALVALYYYIDDMSFEDIAATIGLSERTARRRAEEFIERARKYIDAEGVVFARPRKQNGGAT